MLFYSIDESDTMTQTTLITGASSGIGEALARRFAARGDHLVVVARSRDRLEPLAAELRTSLGATVHPVALDLSAPDAVDRLVAECDALGLTVDTLVNNAGFATHGDVADADPQRLAQQIQLNCVAVASSSARFAAEMRRRGSGTIVNIASTAAFQPIPHMAVYGATKAFVLSFTEALWDELRGSGVRVLAVCPGATDTPFFDVAGEAAAAGSKRTTDQLLETVFAALDGTAPSVVDGFGNAFVSRFVTRLMPKRALIRMAGRTVAP